VHEGIDIMAPMGAPVRAIRNGSIVKFFESGRGGITIYEADAEGRYLYYYAHLSSRAFGLAEGQQVRQGQVIGYVGQTGNATTPHLHFEIQRMGPDGQWWTAQAVNPYPYLLSGEVPR
jgi:murein DD-endopeptidase MepM/ murein hydrolase activator NlpD